MSQEQNRAAETEIEPLSDEALEEVSGGVCSDTQCSNTVIVSPLNP
jgi:hypothetical protein